jgi:transcription elongation factor Elf1
MNSQNKSASQRPSGFNCPICRGFIPVSIQQLLRDERFVCPTCFLEIRLNRANSQNALNALQKVQDAEEKVKKASVFDGKSH